MPTFRSKPEIVDGRQFEGGAVNGTNLTNWVFSRTSHVYALWRGVGDYEAIHIITADSEQVAYIGDWIIQHQNGRIEVVRPQKLAFEYEQV